MKSLSPRKIAGLLMAAGLVVGMFGSGVGAAFTDSVLAIQNIKVGTFGCTISSTTPNAVVSNAGKTVTYNAPDIMGSAAGNSPFSFTVTSTGNIPVNVHLTQTTPVAPFTSILVNPADVVLPAGQNTTYAAGLQWPELVTADLGKAATITYTANCGEVPAAPVGQTPIDPKYTTPRSGNNLVFLCDYVGSPLVLTQVQAMPTQTNGVPGSWMQWPAGNSVGSTAYVLAYNDGQTAPPLSACPQFVTVHFWKTVDNSFGGTAVAADFAMTLSQNFSPVVTGYDGQTVQVLPGAYSLSEVDPTATYGGIQGGCYLNAIPSAAQPWALDVTMAGGETWYCGFVNQFPPNLFFSKTVVGGTAQPVDFTIHLNSVGHSYAGTGDGAGSFGVVAGTYTLTETGPTTGYTSDGGNCTNFNTNEVLPGPTVVITANPGDLWMCSFTNTAQ